MLNIYKASAGSGKTFTLAREYIRLLLSGSAAEQRQHSHILAVTFTKKATAEMKERILGELFILATQPETSAYYSDFTAFFHLDADALRQRTRRQLFALLQDYTHFSVSTIDGFFQQIVRAFARELGLPAMYNLTLDSEEVIAQAVDDLLFRINQSAIDAKDAGAWLSEYAMQNIREGKSWNPREAIEKISLDLLTERLQAELQAIRPLLTNKELLRAYKKELQTIIDRGTAEWKGKVVAKLPEDVAARRRDYFTAEAILKNLDALGILSDVSAQISLTNQEQGRLPISDINLLLNRVIDHTDAPFVYEKIGSRIHHYMIDEFQDTSVLQWENFRPLVAEANANGRDNLIVGDVKQSIYRWRNSDWHLLESVHHEIQPSTLPKMDTNFRSSQTIVEANNDIFDRYCRYAANMLEKDIKWDLTHAQAIRDAYSTLEQKAAKKNLTGYVNIRFYDPDQCGDTGEQALTDMVAILRDVCERGYQPGEVAVLVRNGKEAQRVSACLIENGYEVQSAEGLLVMNHPAMEVLICLLSLIVHPEDDMLTARLRLAFAQHQHPDNQQQAIEQAMSDAPLFSEEEQALITRIHHLSLMEAVQALVDGFHLTEWEQAEPYVVTFMDIVYQYCENQIADIGTFLTYWERKQEKAAIPSSNTPDAVQVMTIHKSKGLEFEVVIVPFVSWPVAAGKRDLEKILWCRTDVAPFNALPLLPVTSTKALADTHFFREYAQERRDLYMDNLNLSYVAFTRPRRELYAMAEIAPKTSKGEDSIKNAGHLMNVILRDTLNEENCYIRGERSIHGPREADESKPSAETRAAQYCSVAIGNRLRLSTHTRADQELDLQDFGTLMHDLLAEIELEQDAADAITHYLYIGRAREEDLPRIKAQMEQFWALVAGRHWFDGTYTILREQDILSPAGSVYRPDRVMIKDGEAIVIDYKFGEHHRPAYRDQVRGYIGLLTQMGYRTRGYLVYVTLGTIEEIE